jgi:cytoskeletal protein CcmA (bactofilin family)
MWGKALVFGGDLIGDLSVDRVVISVRGKVSGNITARFLKIEGKFEGAVCADEVIIADTARVTGKIVAKILTIEPGAEIVGEISSKNNG